MQLDFVRDMESHLEPAQKTIILKKRAGAQVKADSGAGWVWVFDSIQSLSVLYEAVEFERCFYDIHDIYDVSMIPHTTVSSQHTYTNLFLLAVPKKLYPQRLLVGVGKVCRNITRTGLFPSR